MYNKKLKLIILARYLSLVSERKRDNIKKSCALDIESRLDLEWSSRLLYFTTIFSVCF